MKRRQMLETIPWAMAALSGLPLGWATPPETKKRVLYFTRSVGFEHSPVHREQGRLGLSEQVLTDVGKRAGCEVDCTKDGAVFDGNLDGYDLFAFYTCGDLTQPGKDPGRPMTPQGKRRLLEAIASGKGFIGFHSAADTFHSPGPRGEIQTDLDPYVAMLGGEFVTHGAQQEASLILSSRFPGASGLGCAEGISFTDEWYALKNFAQDLHVILVQETRFLKGDCYRRPDFPCSWARMHGKGRVFYTSLGHRDDIWTNPFFQAIMRGGFDWALGSAQANITPNMDQVTPQANQLKSQPGANR
jgi:type 1 glutamine amidotransferase